MNDETPKAWPCRTHKEPTKDCESCYQAFVNLFEKSVPQHVYTRGGRAAVTGIPGQDHNCDEMSCSSIEHVLFRLPHSDDEKRDLFKISGGCILNAESLQTIIDSPNFRDYEKAMAKEIQLHRSNFGAKPCGCEPPAFCAKCA
jgi:hypothetical protein